MPHRIGYVGLDHPHAEPYLESIDALPATLVGACDPGGALAPADLGLDVPAYDDAAALLDAEAPDVLWVSASNRETPGIVRAAVERGVDVYTEKTVARTAADLAPLVDLAADRGVTVGVAYQNRGLAPPRAMRDRAAAGFFGDVQAVELRMVTSKLAYRDTASDVYDRAASRGGILQWLGCHWIDLAAWLLADPVERVAARTRHDTDGVDVEDGATVQFETRDGALGTLQAGYYDRGYDTHVGVHGTDGNATWERFATGHDRDELHLESCDGAWPVAPRRTVTYEYESAPGYGGQPGLDYMTAFLDAAAGDGTTDLVATLDDAAHVLRVLDAAYEAAETGDWVAV